MNKVVLNLVMIQSSQQCIIDLDNSSQTDGQDSGELTGSLAELPSENKHSYLPFPCTLQLQVIIFSKLTKPEKNNLRHVNMKWFDEDVKLPCVAIGEWLVCPWPSRWLDGGRGGIGLPTWVPATFEHLVIPLTSTVWTVCLFIEGS